MKLYFPQITPLWGDWVEVVNVGDKTAHIEAIGRNRQGEVVWRGNQTLSPFKSWIISLDIEEDVSLEIDSSQLIVGARYIYSEAGIAVLSGASVQGRTVGKRFFLLSELLPGTKDWFRFLNVGELDAHVFLTVWSNEGQIITQRDITLPPFHWWDVGERERNVPSNTNFEILSDQPLVVERHIYYRVSGREMMYGYICQAIGG